MAHISEESLKSKLESVRKQIDFESFYYHYKNPTQFYEIENVALIEVSEQPAVIYKARYGQQLRWIRPIDEFFAEQTNSEGEKVSKFTPIKLGAAVIVVNEDDQVLLSLRGENSKNQQLLWESTGGQVEIGESFEEAVRREFREERGCEVIIGEILHETHFYVEDEGQQWYYRVYSGSLDDGQEPRIVEPEKCYELRWVDKSDLKKYKSELASYTKNDFEILGWM